MSIFAVRSRVGLYIFRGRVENCLSTGIVRSRLIVDFKTGSTIDSADISVDLCRTITIARIAQMVTRHEIYNGKFIFF